MKIFMVGSKYCFDKMAPVKELLERTGHMVTLPSAYNDPFKELEMRQAQDDVYMTYKRQKLLEQSERVAMNDAILVMNFEKNGHLNYIGGATFLEVFKAWELEKKIFFYNPLPEGSLYDELRGMGSRVIHGDLSKIVQ
jgi:hypothetical protein